MWEDVLNIVDDETGNDERRLFLQDETWDGSQYIRSAFHHALHQDLRSISHALHPSCPSFIMPFIHHAFHSSCFMLHYLLRPVAAASPNQKNG